MDMIQLIGKHISISQIRAEKVASSELARLPVKDVGAMLKCLEPEKRHARQSEPCGPLFNRQPSLRTRVLISIIVYTGLLLGTAGLFPLQLWASTGYVRRKRFDAFYREILTPNVLLSSWSLRWDAEAYVKAPLSIVNESTETRAALCINSFGEFRLLHSGYAIVSHAWAETMGWATRTALEPVELAIRKRGMPLLHLRRLFDNCKTPVEWLWLDALAIPETLEDMTLLEKEQTEVLRTKCMNNLRRIYTNADYAVVLDSTLLRLRTESPLDVAVVLSLSRWMSRLWRFTEGWLVKAVKLQTNRKAFDLDEIIHFLDDTVTNAEHRYWPLYESLMRSRPSTLTSLQELVRNTKGEHVKNPPTLARIYLGNTNRLTHTEVDHARAIYPILDLQWTPGWKLEDGISYIHASFPNDTEWLEKYLEYRNLARLLPILGRSSG